MFLAQPQSIMSVFFASLKAYKKVFIPILPISIILMPIQIAPQILGSFFRTAQLWVVFSVAVPIVFLSMFCSCWALCFVYDILVKEQVSYRASLNTARKGFFKTLVLFIIFILIILMLGVIGGVIGYCLPNFNANEFFSGNKIIATIFFWPAILFFSYCIGTFGIVYTLDVLVKNAKVLAAMERAAKITFRVESMWRMLCFVVLFILASILFIALIVILLSLIRAGLKSIVSGEMMMGVVAILLLFPFNLAILINIYNDLTLRFEKHG